MAWVDLSDIARKDWSNYETGLVASHILDDGPGISEQFVDAACSTHYDGFVGDVTELAYNTWDEVAWFSEVQARVNWREIAEALRYV